MFYVYAISSLRVERIYIGYTNNIEKRLKYHNSGYVKSTSRDRPWKLIALESLRNRDDARWIEYSLKKSKGKRINWLENNRIKLQATPRREGAARASQREFIQFLYISLGSLSELETQWLLANDLAMTKERPGEKIESTRKMLLGLIRSLKNKIQKV